MTHPIIHQLRFTRSEFLRGLEGVSAEEARRRFEPMNCLAWNLGHLAWQEQRYCVTFAQGLTPRPDLNQQFAYGAPASTPELADMRAAWDETTTAADAWLSQVTTEQLAEQRAFTGGSWTTSFGNLLHRLIYHYWYHTGENLAIRQLLGHKNLPDFVGNIDDEAPYLPEAG